MTITTMPGGRAERNPTMSNDLLEQFRATWSIFMNKKLPELIHSPEKEVVAYEEDSMENAPELARPLTPLVGALPGVALYIPTWILYHLFGTWAAGIFAGVCAPLCLEYLSGWRGLSNLADYINLRKNGFTQTVALLHENVDDEPERSLPESSIILYITIYILRMALFAALGASGAAFWFVAALTGAYLARAELASAVIPGTETPFLDPPERFSKWHWYIGGAVMLFFSAVSTTWYVQLPALGTALILIWLVSWYALHLCLDQISGMTQRAIDIFGYTTEILLLILGTLFFTGGGAG